MAMACAAVAAETSVESVYFLPMSNSLELYVANRVTAEKVYRVTTDPKRAEAVFTDKLGEEFERKMDELFPPLDKPEVDPEKQEERQTRAFASRARGTVFLVDARTRHVIWSGYLRPKNSTPDELDRTAKKIVEQLKRDLQPPAAK